MKTARRLSKSKVAVKQKKYVDFRSPVSYALHMETGRFIEELWGYAREVPMGEHPWFQGILQHRWTREQIILGEVQHYLRIRTNPIFFGYMAINAVNDKNYELMEAVLDNFMEELAGPRTHMDISLQFLEEGGISREEADRASRRGEG